MKEKDREKGSKSDRVLHLVKDPEDEKENGLKPDTAWIKNQKGNKRFMDVQEPEEDELWEEDGDGEKGNPWVTALTFLGLGVLAAIICAVLWYFTHPEGDGGQDLPPAAEAGEDFTGEALPGEDAPTDPGQEPGEEGEPNPGQGPGEGDDPSLGQEPGEEGNPGPGQEGEQDAAGEGVDISQPAQPPEEQEPADGTAAMKFTEQQESVTPKDVVNLRSVPTTKYEEYIVVQCKNGEILKRTGINNDTGWSEIDYDGQTLYAVSRYLTTDLDYKTPVQTSNPNRVSTAGGRVILFTDCDDWISPKEYVNLRNEPSTDGGNGTVSCQLEYGEKAHRTGYSTDSGWSRVEYDGKVLYVVTSLVYVVDPG